MRLTMYGPNTNKAMNPATIKNRRRRVRNGR
jgi:hypothetical protein